MKTDEIRVQHIEFIHADTKERGEVIVSDITFIGALYNLDVKCKESKKVKNIMYSAAERFLKSYRKIEIM